MVEDLKKISVSNKVEVKDIDNKGLAKKKVNSKILKIAGTVFLGIFLIVLILGITVMWLLMPLVANLKTTFKISEEAYQQVKNQDLIATEQKIKELKEDLAKTKSSYQKLAWLKIIPLLNIYYKDGEQVALAAETGVEAAQILVEAVTPYADVLGLKGKGSFTGGTVEDRLVKILQTLGEITPKLSLVEEKLAVVKQSLDQINPNDYPENFQGKPIRPKIIEIKKRIDEIVTGVSEARPALESLPQILGYPNSKKYLVIMQNDGELRATGGFMTAYAVTKIESGKVIIEKSDDIYSLDAKNKKKVKAPESIVKYLFSADLKTGIVPYWYLRDMNLSPDFKTSMEMFKQYYDELPQEAKVDGIIALDTKMLKDFLTILGPIEVPNFGKFSMDKDARCHNIPQVVCELEYIVGEPLPNVKVDRKGVLGPLTKAIITKVFDSPSSTWPSLFKLGLTQIREKHLLFYFTDNKLQQAAESLNAAGRIRTTDKDYLHINDTNFGGAKSNLFVQHGVEQKISLNQDNKIETTLTLTYTNPEKMDNCNLERKSGLCLNGILRNFVRIYVPKGSKLIEARGSETEMKTYQDLDKTVFEGFFTLRGDGGRAKVEITYESGYTYDSNKGYDLLIQKQGGTVGHHYKVMFENQVDEFNLIEDRQLHF